MAYTRAGDNGLASLFTMCDLISSAMVSDRGTEAVCCAAGSVVVLCVVPTCHSIAQGHHRLHLRWCLAACHQLQIHGANPLPT